MWEIVTTAEYKRWFRTLKAQDQARLLRTVDRLRSEGPILSRPNADAVRGSSHSNMKELRPTQTLRVFYAFDTQQRAVLLCGGDKAVSKKEEVWYKKMIRRADVIFRDHLTNMGRSQPHGGA